MKSGELTVTGDYATPIIATTAIAGSRYRSGKLPDSHFDGQLLQSKKKKTPRYTAKLDPTSKRSMAGKRDRKNEDEDGGCCDNATPCQRGVCSIF